MPKTNKNSPLQFVQACQKAIEASPELTARWKVVSGRSLQVEHLPITGAINSAKMRAQVFMEPKDRRVRLGFEIVTTQNALKNDAAHVARRKRIAGIVRDGLNDGRMPNAVEFGDGSTILARTIPWADINYQGGDQEVVGFLKFLDKRLRRWDRANGKKILSRHSRSDSPSSDSTLAKLLDEAASKLDQDRYFQPPTPVEERRRRLVEIEQRRGQRAFRCKLLAAYENKCAITGCDAEDALEAAHITPYSLAATDDSG